jgi:hypothetical protein
MPKKVPLDSIDWLRCVQNRQAGCSDRRLPRPKPHSNAVGLPEAAEIVLPLSLRPAESVVFSIVGVNSKLLDIILVQDAADAILLLCMTL